MLPLLFLFALSTFPISAILTKTMPPLLLIALRMGIAGSIISLYLLFARRCAITFNKKHIFLYLQIILFAGIVPYFLRYWALSQASSQQLSFWFMLTPLIGYIVSCSIHKTAPTAMHVIAFLLGFTGITFAGFIPSAPTFSWIDVACIASIIVFSYGWVLIQKMILEHNYSILFLNALIMIITGLSAAILSYNLEQMPVISELSAIALPLLAIVVVGNLIAHNLYGYLLQHYSLTILQMGVWISPIVLGIMQQVVVSTIMGLFLIITAFIIFYRKERMQLLPAKV